MSEAANPGLIDEARGPREVWGRTAEVLALTLAVPLVATLARVADPFFVHAAFPWLVLVAILIGAQHGLLAALIAAGLWSAGAWGHAVASGTSLEGLRSWSLGCSFVGLVTGWFHDQAELRGRQLSARAAVAEARQLQISRAQRALQLSHARLEVRLLAGEWSLESILRQASRELGRASTADGVYGVVLEVLAGQAQIHAASLFTCRTGHRRDARPPQLEAAPAVCFGRARPGAAQHPVVQRALATRQVALLAPERLGSTPEENAVLAAVPLLTSGHQWLGVIAVHDMPFIAFSPEAFSELLVVAERLADLVAARLAVLAGRSPALEGRLPAVLEPRPLAEAPWGARAELVSLRERAALARAPESRGRRPPSGVRLKLEDRLPPQQDAVPPRRDRRHS